MARLVALSAGAGLMPRSIGTGIGTVTLTEVDLGPVTLIAPFRGRREAVTDVLQAAFGLSFPAPGSSLTAGSARLIWTGPDKALLVGVPPPPGLDDLAARVDQSDGSVTVQVEGLGAGLGAEAVLARLIPLDLRVRVFPIGQTARTLVNHMTASVTRTGDQTFEVMVFRSMARTLVTELTEAAQGVAARP